MFNRKSDHSFSVMIAEELLRAELERLFGRWIKFYQRNLTTTPVRRKKRDDGNVSKHETEFFEKGRSGPVEERYVEITAIIGPFEREYPDNPPEDTRRRLRRVTATCRVYSVLEGSILWRPHFLRFRVFDDRGEMVVLDRQDCWRHYEQGFVGGVFWAKNAENPCQDMFNNQISATYAVAAHGSLHGLD